MNKTYFFGIVFWKEPCGYCNFSEFRCVTDNTDVNTEMKCVTKHWEREGSEGLIITLVETRPYHSVRCVSSKLINCLDLAVSILYSVEELPDPWKEYIIVPVHKESD
jgi:hypothetical protein